MNHHLGGPVDILSGLGRIARRVFRPDRWRFLRGGWLPGYLLHHRPFRQDRLRGAMIDIMVLVADHFEPSSRNGPEAAAGTVATWCQEYTDLALRYRDADGRPFQHTWFYRAEYANDGCLGILSDHVFKGLGEVEFHLHHGHDTHESFLARLQSGLDWFNRGGAMLTAEPVPRRRFAYIAGNWALDNGAGDDALSGCNTELLALRQAGCYADFTFPALGSPAQPRLSNAIYQATDTPAPKSYDRGVRVAVGSTPSGDLLIFQGPLVLDWRAGRIEGAELETGSPPAPARLRAWLKANIHVAGRPEWLFVKLHTHGMQSRRAFLGPGMEATLSAMQSAWNRPPFRLHFVTAREAYNIVRAAQAGHSGNPNDFRDFAIARPANRLIRCDRPWRLLSYRPDCVSLELPEGGPAMLEFAEGPLRSVCGRFSRLEASCERGQVRTLWVDGDGFVEVSVAPGKTLPQIVRGRRQDNPPNAPGQPQQPLRIPELVG